MKLNKFIFFKNKIKKKRIFYRNKFEKKNRYDCFQKFTCKTLRGLGIVEHCVCVCCYLV